MALPEGLKKFLGGIAFQTGEWIEEMWGIILFVISLAVVIRVLDFFGSAKLAGTDIPWEWIIQYGELGILIVLFGRLPVGSIKAVVRKWREP